VQDRIDGYQTGGEHFTLEEAMKIALSVGQGLSAFHSLQPPRAFRDLKVLRYSLLPKLLLLLLLFWSSHVFPFL